MKKGIGTYGIIGIILVIAAVVFIADVPAIVSGWYHEITGQAFNCDDDPYGDNCFCGDGQRKIEVKWLGTPKWSCETLAELLIDPESPTFEQDSISFVQNYLSRYCGSTCTDLSCGGNICGCPPGEPYCGAFASSHPSSEADNPCIAAAWGWGQSGARVVNVECIAVDSWYPDGTPHSGHAPWRMQFFVESATSTPTAPEVLVSSNYCVDEPVTKRCTHQSVCDYFPGEDWCVGDLPMNSVPNDYPYMLFSMVYSSNYPPAV